MLTLHGTVRHARHSSNTVGSGFYPYFSVSTLHLAVFELSDGTRVQFSSPRPPIISPGDQITIVGERTRDGVFIAHAYHNLSAQVTGDDRRHLSTMAIGLALIALGPALVALLLDSSRDFLPLVPFLLLCISGAGLIGTIKGWRAWSFVRSLRRIGRDETDHPPLKFRYTR